MNGNEFCKRFQLASYFCRDFTNRHIVEELPEALRYNFARTERQSAVDDKVTFNSRVYLIDQLMNLSPKEALRFLFKDGCIPVWIDLFVGSFHEKFTCIEVTFSNDFTENETLLYHQKEMYPPFHVVGPTAPEKWNSIESDGCFPFIEFT